MAEKFIEEIYGYANTISRLRYVVDLIRIMDDRKALTLLKTNLTNMEKLRDACIQDDYPESKVLSKNLASMADIKDIIFLADMLENVAIPIMERWLQSWVCIEEQVDENYSIESTSGGFLTIKNTRADRYLHSNNDPMDEARKIIERQYDYEKSSYMIWGCGLGYHVYQLYLFSKGTIPIRVYESDANMIQYAYKYGVLSWIPQDILEVVPVEDAEQFFENRKSQDGVFFLLPYIHTTADVKQRHLLMEHYIQQSSIWESSHELLINFNRNKELKLPDISQLDHTGMKEDMVVIAGGPSVDHVIDDLRKWQGKKTLIAVGTIWKRLIHEGIRPDYAVILDPYETVYSQIEGIEDDKAVLLVGMLAYWKVARSYKGDVYSICVKGPIHGLDEYARMNGLELWESGGTVTALAMEFAIRFGAHRIYLAGVDMAYPNGVSHASGTRYKSNVEISQLTPIPKVGGGIVYTNETFNLYRKWIEYRISQNPDIKFINMSDAGAQIAGAMTYQNV